MNHQILSEYLAAKSRLAFLSIAAAVGALGVALYVGAPWPVDLVPVAAVLGVSVWHRRFAAHVRSEKFGTRPGDVTGLMQWLENRNEPATRFMSSE